MGSQVIPRYFTCVMCKGTFESAWTEEEKQDEAKRLFPLDEISEMASVCDDCNQEMIEWVLGGMNEKN